MVIQCGGFNVVCQTRSADKFLQFIERVQIYGFDPCHADSLSEFVNNADAVIFALGTNTSGSTTLFSESTAALITAMKEREVHRLIAITVAGAGETRGHGVFLYDWIIFPLFTRRRYHDKDRQEALIAASELDWIIVRPAAFSERLASGSLEVHTETTRETRLTRITSDEVADFVVAQLQINRYLRPRPFIGHA